MEGKCVLFKEFGGVDAFPICLDTQNSDEIVNIVKNLSISFGGINLEDIASPRCFEIERRLNDELDIPVFHDDQHGTAVIVLAGLLNALKLAGKSLEEVRVVTSGAGAAGTAIIRLLCSVGLRNVIMTDIRGAVYEGRPDLTGDLLEMARQTNPEKRRGSLAEVLPGADVFIGVSAPGVLKREMVRTMAKNAIDRKSTRLNSSHTLISYAVFYLKKKKLD